MATMTHEEMEAVIDQGGSVIYQGVIYSTKESLPSDAELTEGDPAKEAAAAEAIDKQIAALESLKAGIGKVSLYGREYLIKVQPREKGLVMYTLRHASEIRSMDAIDELSDMPESVKPDEVKLAKQVMSTFEGPVDLKTIKDEYQEGLREIIDAKIEGREVVTQEVEEPPKVVNLMEALRKSLDTISAKKKPARKKAAKKKAAKRKK